MTTLHPQLPCFIQVNAFTIETLQEAAEALRTEVMLYAKSPRDSVNIIVQDLNVLSLDTSKLIETADKSGDLPEGVVGRIGNMHIIVNPKQPRTVVTVAAYDGIYMEIRCDLIVKA